MEDKDEDASASGADNGGDGTAAPAHKSLDGVIAVWIALCILGLAVVVWVRCDIILSNICAVRDFFALSATSANAIPRLCATCC